MSWLFSQALVEEYWGDTSLDGEQSAPLSGNNIQQAYCAPDKMTKFSRLSRFGMTYKPLTETRGEELLTLYLEDFHAKTSQLQEREMDLMANDHQCGHKWHGLLARFDQDTHSWRTVQCSLIGDLNESLQTLPAWGMTVGGELYLRQTLVQTIKEKESGYWLTPNCMDSLPPRTPEALKKQHENNRQGRSTHSTLREQVAYPPPNQMWPTPATRDYKGANSFKTTQEKLLEGRRSHMGQLPNAVMMGEQEEISGTLNPSWVEWLMNWPINWSNLNAIDPKEYQRWKETSTKTLQKSEQLREMWWDNDPSQASFGQQPNKQSEQQHCNAVPQMSRDTTRQREMEGSHEGSDLPLLCNDIYLSESQAENVQSGMWEQIGMDETKIVPRTDKNIVARVDRLKAIGNGQVPLCAATAWELLK